MNKTKYGYFVFCYDYGNNVSVYFLEYSKDTYDIFQKISSSFRKYEDMYDDWIDWMDDRIANNNEPEHCGGLDPWKFNGYHILDYTTIYDI